MNAVPKVAHVVISLQHGGLEQCAVQWCHVRNRMHPGSTAIVCLSEPGPLSETINDVTVFSLGANRSQFPWDRSAVIRFREIIAARDIEVLHSHNTAARQYASLACRKGRPRHVYTDHGSNIYLCGIPNRIRLAFMKRRTNAIVAVSSEAAEALARAEHIPTDDIRIIRNGVTMKDTAPPGTQTRDAIRKQWGIPREAFVTGYVGRLSHEKGVDRLITSFAALPDLRPPSSDLRLVLVGDGPMRGKLEQLVRDLDISEHVIFLGAQSNARALMPGFDLFVLPSRSEGLPLALLEAMAESVPVATTNVGECASVLDGGRLGDVLPDDDSEWPGSLTHLIAKVRSGSKKTSTSNARRRVKDNYSIEHTIDQYETLYQP